MALPNFLLLFMLLVPSFQALYDETHSNDPNQTSQSLIVQTCQGIENPDLCHSNLQARLGKQDNHNNPHSIFKAALEATLDEANQAIDRVSGFSTLSTSLREQMAIQDCKELLDFSVSELSWSLAEMNKVLAGLKSSPHKGNLKAWLSAALSNQDTCLEGFEGTDRRLEGLFRGNLGHVTGLIGNVLALHSQIYGLPRNSSTRSNQRSEFPRWMAKGDEELLLASPKGMHVDAVVALDGSGHHKSIAEAVNEAPDHSRRRYVIYIKRGVYGENIDMKKKKTNIMFIGDGMGATVVAGSRSFTQGWTTFRTATVAVSGTGFIARDMTFRNSAGPRGHQAVALRVDSDQSAFYRCSIEGFQDSLYIHSLRQFYRECDIHGTVDFIFGNGAAVLQGCRIFTREPLPMQKVTITAQGRKSPNQNTGFSIQDSYVYASQPAYLGRPWKQYSRTIFMHTFMNELVQPRGWLEWFGNYYLDTLWYGEYMNYGPGAALGQRVKWPGFHIVRDASVAKLFTVGRFIDGVSWLPATGIKFTAGLSD
ncbi:Pectinesterase [Bertholletia excelsa]